MLRRFFILPSLLSAVAFGFSGCLPARWPDTPELSGSVLDAATRRPIGGARLHYEKFPKYEAFARADGQYHFPGIDHRKWVSLFLVDYLPTRQDLTIEAPGYISTRIPEMARMRAINEKREDIYLHHE